MTSFRGETYQHVHLASGGVIPAGLDTNDYLRWEFTGDDQLWLEPNTQYAFLFLFDEPAAPNVNRNIPLSNINVVPEGALTDPFPDGHMIRRDGSSTVFDELFIANLADEADKAVSRASASFPTKPSGEPDMAARLAIQPGTLGYPDVDTYRDMYFIMEAAAPEHSDYSFPASKDAYAQGDNAANKAKAYGSTDSGRLAAVTLSWRKTWIGFDLAGFSFFPRFEQMAAVELVLTSQSDLTNIRPGSRLNVYGLTDDSLDGWSQTALTFNNAPGNNVNHAWQVNAAKTVLLGSIAVPAISSAGKAIRIPLDLDLFPTLLGNNIATLIVTMKDDTGTGNQSSAWSYSKEGSASSGPVLKITTVPYRLTLESRGAAGYSVAWNSVTDRPYRIHHSTTRAGWTGTTASYPGDGLRMEVPVESFVPGYSVNPRMFFKIEPLSFQPWFRCHGPSRTRRHGHQPKCMTRSKLSFRKGRLAALGGNGETNNPCQ